MVYSALPASELVRACAQPGDPAAWEEFVRRFQPLVATVAMRTAARWGESSRQSVDDLVQETYLKLCANRCRLLRHFVPCHQDAIYGFLKVVTVNVVHDHFKSRHASKRHPGHPEQDSEPAEVCAPQGQAGSAETMERAIFLNEIDELLRSCACGPTKARDCTIFWLYYRQGFTARAIASIPWIGLSEKGVESTIQRLTRAVRSEIGERRGVERPTKEPQCSATV